ncbi:hypothetical protein [Pseudomonas brassicacearum]|jgi:hypothetical protein|uniref:Uncharacterized protein n=1 Tax=Pseudomonas brassicacearum TaxID=930166 RepID=A0A423GV66_9PSED|nr:hypothetical protein [Pseudomonas brassicacearum]RON01305.1 hypothetical protein BK658_09075 [Pseudomonas brassicacearum]
MRDTKKSKSKDVTDDTKVRYAIDFIEELSWLLDSKKNLKLSEVPTILRTKLLSPEPKSGSADNYISPNPNIHYLIGVLPRLFQDIKLFSRNEDIAEFANEVLGIDISRVEKRSKYELIGLIVCEANDLDDAKLENLVLALSSITGSSEKLSFMINEKSSIGFSWNETIIKLGLQND